MNQLPSPIRISDSAGRIECSRTLETNGQFQPCCRFIAEPPVIGSTGQRKPKTISSSSATM
jgi:hypothetical protein